MAKVSVIVPAYNQGSYLGHAIQSVLGQTFSDWELFVIDDGSTDNTREIVASYTGDSRIHYLYQNNQERAAARNRGIASSSGRYVAFLDADDLWLPEKLSEQVLALDARLDVGLCYTLARTITDSLQWLDSERHPLARSGMVFAHLLRTNFIAASSVVVRRRCLDDAGGFDTALRASEDWDLWLRVARRYSVLLIKKELTLRRQHAANTSYRQVLEGQLTVLDKLFSGPEFPNPSGIQKRQAYAYAYLSAAGLPPALIQSSERGRLLLSALHQSPFCLLTPPGLLALARLLLPESIVHRLKRG